MMTEIKVEIQNTNNAGFGIKVIKSDSHKGGLIIKEISAESPATKANLKIGDHIVKVNNKSVKNGRTKFMLEINDSKQTSISLHILRDVKESRHQSFMNLSCSISSITSSFQTFRNSKSSTDLNFYTNSQKVLDSNFVHEESITNYIEDINESSTALSQSSQSRNNKFNWANNRSVASLDNFTGDNESCSIPQLSNSNTSTSPSTAQITRKKAYKKDTDDIEHPYQSPTPKINIKKATSSGPSFSQKDPQYIVRKKTNSPESQHISTRNVQTPMTTKIRYSAVPIKKLSVSNNASARTVGIPLANNEALSQSLDSEDGNCFSAINKTIVLSSSLTASQPLPVKTPETSDPTNFMELDVKVTIFREKITKPSWKKYSVERENTGIIFQCLDPNRIQTSSNSTALDPKIVSTDLLMKNWDVNNDIHSFYLPIGQSPYDLEISRMATIEEIKITFQNKNVEFFISLQKVNSQNQTLLFKLLIVDPPEPKIVPMKHKKSISGQDLIRSEIKRTKQPKIVENLLLNSLYKTKQVESVPLVVIICVTIVEEFGYQEEGMYRKSGNLSGKKVLEDIVANEHPERWSSHDEWTNIHTVSNLLKSILRKYTLFDKDTAIKLSVIRLDLEENKNDIERKVQLIMDMIYHLCTHFKSHSSVEENKCRLDTFKYIIKHLYRMTLYQEFTKMSAENLATCFMPTLIEDIPSDDGSDFKDSKKSVIYENLKKMGTFWITHADMVFEFLEEEKEEELNKKVIKFLTEMHIPNHNFNQKLMTNIDDVSVLIKEKIDFYTESSFLPSSGSGYSSPTGVNTPESYFSRTKNSRPYQSVKQPRKNNIRKRNNSGSNLDMIKPEIEPGTQKPPPKVAVGSPTNTKKSDIWQTKIVKKKKDALGNDIQGTAIVNLLISGNKKDVPLVVVACVKIIEQFGLITDGVYRVNGKNQDVLTLDSIVMTNETDKWTEESNLKIWANVHNTACLLKKTLKKFRLIPKETWMHMSSQFSEKLEPDDVKNVLKAAAYHLRLEHSKYNIISNLGKEESEDHKSDKKQCEVRFRSGTLRYVLQHLKHISMHESRNRMNSNSLAVCFVPVLMEEDYSSDMIALNTKCIQIVQLLIDHCNWIFQWDGRPSEDMYGQAMSDSLERYLREYEPPTCNETHEIDPYGTSNISDLEALLNRLIQSSFHFADCADSLRMYFENRKQPPDLTISEL